MTDRQHVDSIREQIADVTGGDPENDPLAAHAATFDGAVDPTDPFDAFIAETLEPADLALETRESYERTFRYWREHMEREGRHPALPGEGHVRRFIRSLRGEQTPDTIQKRIHQLRRAWAYWQRESFMPHGTDFDPFGIALSKEPLGEQADREMRQVSKSELRERLESLTHIRDRAIVLAQLKLGLRAGEVRNIQLQDITVEHGDLRDHYPDLGSHRKVRDRENAIYVPDRDERNGNKSQRPRLLPLDDEMRQSLVRYLLIRPDTGTPWVFLTKGNHCQLFGEKTINRAWRDAFPRDEYGETDEHRAVTSHFGRHRFTTYWLVERDMNRELVKYMRGDKTGKDREAIDDYVHTYYEDVRDRYLDEIYKLL